MSNETRQPTQVEVGTRLQFTAQPVRVTGRKAWARKRYTKSTKVFGYGVYRQRPVRLPDEPCENIRVWSPSYRRSWTLRLRNQETDAERGNELSLLYARHVSGEGEWHLIAIRNDTTGSVCELDAGDLIEDLPGSTVPVLHGLGAACVGVIGAVLSGDGAANPFLWLRAASCGACAWFIKFLSVSGSVHRQVTKGVARLQQEFQTSGGSGGAA